MISLGVNIDHIATLRNARNTIYPSIVEAALIAQTNGADLITMHLREDRRHIKDEDVFDVKNSIKTRLNLEMALTKEMLDNALKVQPQNICIVPENRKEVTTESGLDVIKNSKKITEFNKELQKANIQVSLFIDADKNQIIAAKNCGVQAIEIHTGEYADATDYKLEQKLLQKIEEASYFASEIGLIVNAGHGLNIHNVGNIAKILPIKELNIGHSIIAQAIFLGLPKAIAQMKDIIYKSRSLI